MLKLSPSNDNGELFRMNEFWSVLVAVSIEHEQSLVSLPINETTGPTLRHIVLIGGFLYAIHSHTVDGTHGVGAN